LNPQPLILFATLPHSRWCQPLLCVVFAFALSILTPSMAEARQQSWYDGGIQYSTITNCVSIIQGFPYQENGAGAFVGFLANPTSSQPSPNTTYYIHVYVAGLGNSCSGQRFYLDVALPPNTTLAITGATPVYCFAGGGQVTGADCPQSMPASSLNPGAFALYSNDSAHANLWPLPQGGNWEFQIPVRSTTTLTSATLQANVKVLDGNSSPWLRPQQGVYVFSGQPTILHPSPSTIDIAPTTARSEAYLYTNSTSLTGTGYFELGTTASYGLILDPVSITGGSAAYLVWDNWGPPALQPDTLYHWRFKFTPNGGGATIFGPDQTFRTRADGKLTVGSGSAGGCTEAAFAAAFNTAGTKQIVFDCGAVPVTIPITSTRTISSAAFTTLLIDGGGKVTLQRQGSGNHFTVTGGALTLKRITLSNGISTCGGAINVSAGAQLILDDARFIANQSSQQGGAVCNNGTTTATNSLFSDNVAGSHGGAIGNYSTLSVTNSKFLNNRSNINGGAIDSVGSLTVAGSTFAGNAAGFRGGGINAFVGALLNISTSSFLTNSAGLYGGGVSSDGVTTSIASSTFSANSSNNHGGGIEMSGDKSLTLTNTTLTDNTAVTEGGGLYWTASGPPGPLTIVNSTIADNVAGTTGGSIYTGNTGGNNTAITVKNSIVSGGSPGNCSGTVQSSGFNLESANTCGFGGAGDKPNVAANLGPLLKNAGNTMTRLPLPGSQAIDGGTNTGCPATDQQGLARPGDGDGNGSSICDIGAVELPFPAATITRISPDGGSTAGGQIVTITGTNLSGATVTIGGVGATVNSTTATTATVVTPAHAAGPVNVVVNGAFGSATSTDGYTYFPLVGPSTITATATSNTAVALSWAASSGAASYEVWRSSQGGLFSLVLSTASTAANDTGLTANTTYLYRVRAVAGAGTSAFSLVDAATTIMFSDASLAGTLIRAVHLNELRTAINALRVAAGLDATAFTNGTVSLGSTRIRRLHLVELRAALNVVRSALGLTTLVYTDPTLTAGATPIKAVHVTELRAGTQ
jgi:predicted outer membrane repeat protein